MASLSKLMGVHGIKPMVNSIMGRTIMLKAITTTFELGVSVAFNVMPESISKIKFEKLRQKKIITVGTPNSATLDVE